MSTISTLSQKWVKLLKYSSLYHQPLTEQPVCDIRGKWKFGACQATISVKKTYYLRLRFMCQDISRMQDFAPFYPRASGGLECHGRKDHLASPIHRLDCTTKQFLGQPKF